MGKLTPVLDQLPYHDVHTGIQSITGCLARILDSLEEIEYQERFYGGVPKHGRELALKKTIELREYYNARLMLPVDDPVLMSMTQATAVAIFEYIKHLDEGSVDTDKFLNKLDQEFDKILHPDKPVATDFVKESKSELKKRIDDLFSKSNSQFPWKQPSTADIPPDYYDDDYGYEDEDEEFKIDGMTDEEAENEVEKLLGIDKFKVNIRPLDRPRDENIFQNEDEEGYYGRRRPHGGVDDDDDVFGRRYKDNPEW